MAKGLEKMADERGSRRISAVESGGSVIPSPVRADKPSHRADGTFAPGNSAGGRKPKAVERAYLDAIRQALPPEHMEAVIAEALQLARDTRSWRGLLEVVQFAASYGAGKPTQKTVTTDGNLETLLAALASDAPLLPEVRPAVVDVAGAAAAAAAAGDVGPEV